MSGFADGFVAALVGRSADAEAGIALAGGRVGERVPWGAAPATRPAVLAVEAEGVDDATLADALPGLAALAAARDLPLVVAFGLAQIDVVAAALIDTPAVLLCEAAMVDRVAALAAAAAGPSASGMLREEDAERLRRLNAEVARIATLLAGLVDQEAAAGHVGDRRTSFAPGPATDGRDAAPVAAADIRAAIRARRMRAHFFDPRLLEDPGWDMLLDLFAAELERAQVSVSSLCIASGVAPTTALRWIGRMADAGLIVRVPDADDRRRAFLTLGAGASDAMRGYVAAVRRAGLAIV